MTHINKMENTNKNFNIYIRSNEHPRTINTPKMARTYYTKVVVFGKEALLNKVAELKAKGESVIEITTELGTKVYC